MSVWQVVHILSYGVLLGSQVFQTCINGITAFKSLPRPHFSTLQTAIFPVYFSLQTVLPVAVALTAPVEAGVGASSSGTSFFRDVLIFSDRSRAMLMPLVTVFVTGVINLVIFRPLTNHVIREKRRHELRDRKKSHDAPPHSQSMTALNRRFSVIHATSILINVVGVLATMQYGVSLGRRLS